MKPAAPWQRLRNLHLPERFIMIVAVIFRFFPGAVRGYEAAAAIHPHPGRVHIAASEAASAVILYRNTDRADGFARYPHRRDAVCLPPKHGHRLNPPQKQLSVASVFCVGCCVLRPAGSIDRRRPYPVMRRLCDVQPYFIQKGVFTMSTANPQ